MASQGFVPGCARWTSRASRLINCANVAASVSSSPAWRNRDTFLQGRDEIIDFLHAKWARELNYRLIKELWTFTDNKIAARYCYEFQTASGQWYRAYGNENWEFATPRPADHPGLSDLGL